MIFSADAFNLANGEVQAGNGAVVLRPRDDTRSFGIEAAGATTLTNADVASIHTSDFIMFGSGLGKTFGGNMTVGENAVVEGAGKHLAFLRNTASGGSLAIGSQGVRTTGNVILNAGAGAIEEAAGGKTVAHSLTTFSTGDTTLNGANRIAVFNVTSTAGDVSLANTGVLDVTGMSALGYATINNIGDVTVSGPWNAGGTSTITVGSDIRLNSAMRCRSASC